MGVRSQLARFAKVFGNTEPPEIQAGELAAGMDPSRPFSPGEPIGPYDGFNRTPRSKDFVTGYNISARPRTHERVSFDTLRSLIESYDVAQACIYHRIDSIRSLEWSLVAAEGHESDVADAIAVGMAALKKPDGQTPFSVWLAEWLYDILAYDAGTLYRLRNRAGRTVGLRVVDGSTIAPLLDYWGNTPKSPAEAYVQYVNGVPWNWLTTDDLIYAPFRKRPNSPYGHAPLESILLNANTDLRFQAYFLQRFTEGNIPAAFASAPESWTANDIETFQEFWDGFMAGDQAFKSQIRWMPGGGRIEWSNEKEFSDTFSLFLMRKTAAAYHVVPSDLGFTETVNKSSGETQSDVQHRVGDMPLAHHCSTIITSFLQDDLGLPLQHRFDLGEEQDDRYQTAQADDIYVKAGVVSPSELRELRFGLPEPGGQPVPRFIYTTRAGPIPIASLEAVSGPVDMATAAPAPGAALSHDAFRAIEGVVPVPPIPSPPLAEQIYGPAAVADPQAIGDLEQLALKGEAGPTTGITTETGITGYDLVGHHRRDDDDDEAPAVQHELAKAELTAFRRFRQGRRRAGQWRDFEFAAVNPVQAHRLNDAGRLAVRKATGEIAVAGLAVRAADTGRVLMLQRALDDTDPASGTWEMPGGHLEGDESPLQGAWREWAEETGVIPPPGEQTGTWTSPDGVYQGIVWTVPSEDCVPIGETRDQITNPDDPDGDVVEAIAFWDPMQLPGNPAVRPELLDNIDAVMAALGVPLVGELVKAGDADPKDRGADKRATWPGWHVDEQLAAAYTHQIRQAIGDVLNTPTAKRIARAWLNEGRTTSSPTAWLLQAEPGLTEQVGAALRDVLAQAWTAGWAVGSTSAHAMLAGHSRVDWSKYGQVRKAEGDASTSVIDPSLMVYDQQSLQDWLTHYGIDTITSISSTRMDDLAALLESALEDGDSPDSLAADIVDLGASESSAAAIAVTEISRAVSQAALATYEQAGVGQISWLSVAGACPVCAANETASPIRLGDSFPDGSTGPPSHPNCVIGSTRVIVPTDIAQRLAPDPTPCASAPSGDAGLASAPAVAESERDFGRRNIRAVTVREYVGDVVTIRVASGQELTATPNHPVATPGGWVGITELAVGDHVLCSTLGQWEMNAIDPDVDDIPPRIEDVAETFAVAFGPMPTAAQDFHGDGAGSNVHIVRTDRLLVDNAPATGPQHVGEGEFGDRDVAISAPLVGECDLASLREGLLSASHGVVGCTGEPGALFGASVGHPSKHGVTTATRLNSRSEQPPADRGAGDLEGSLKSLLALSSDVASDEHVVIDDPSSQVSLATRSDGDSGGDENSSDRPISDVEGFCDRLYRLTAEITANEVISVRRHPFDGHVYNLECVEGWYIGNSIVTHNCRCALVPSSVESVTLPGIDELKDILGGF